MGAADDRGFLVTSASHGIITRTASLPQILEIIPICCPSGTTASPRTIERYLCLIIRLEVITLPFTTLRLLIEWQSNRA